MIRWWNPVLLVALAAPGLGAAENELSAEEKSAGYQLLFNGTDLKGFREDPKRGFHKWLVKDGVLTLTPAEPSKDPNFEPYPLWTTEEFENYVLKLDFHTGPNPETGHSGVILRQVGKPSNRPQPGLEVELFGPARKPGYSCTGAFRYALQAPVKSVVKPAGEWNTLVITADKNRVMVELNGEKINELDLDQWTTPGQRPDGTAHLLSKLALKDLPRKGPIGLRDDYGIPVWFRNIKIKPIKDN